MIKESVYVCHESVFTAPTPRPIFWHSIVVRKKGPVCCSWERELDDKFHLESIDPVVMMETPSRPVMKTFPVREGDYLHYRPECIFSTYLARRWEFAIGSFSLWWKHFLHETGTVFITGWKSSLRCSWERDPWSRKQAGRHPPHEEKPGLVRIDRLGANKSGFPQEEEVYPAHSYCKCEVWSGRHDALLGFQPHLNVDLGLSRSNRIHLPVHATGSWILLKSNGWIEI